MHALPNLDAIASAPRVAGLNLGADVARGLLEAYEAALAAGRGAAAFQGRMIDAPVAARARALLRRAGD